MDAENRVVATREEVGSGKAKLAERGQLHGKRWKQNFGGEHAVVYTEAEIQCIHEKKIKSYGNVEAYLLFQHSFQDFLLLFLPGSLCKTVNFSIFSVLRSGRRESPRKEWQHLLLAKFHLLCVGYLFTSVCPGVS